MSALAAEHQAINLSQGFPDFLCDQQLLDRAYYYMCRGCNQYAPMPGILPLRERIAAKTQRLYGASYDAETEITITSGGTEALYAAITALVRDGDEVIVFEPAYDSYVPAIRLNGGHPVPIELPPPDFRIDWDRVRKMINRQTRMIILNNPHNPTGAVLDAQDLSELENLLDGTEIMVLSDEVYEHIVFDGLVHQSVMRFPGLVTRSLVVFSFGKTYHNTGWKMGYCLAPASLMTEFRKAHQFIVFSSNTPLQYAFADMMEQPEHYEKLPAFYQQKRDLFLELIRDLPFTWRPASGSYFQCVGYDRISQMSDYDFCVWLTKEIGVAAIPLSSFYIGRTDHHLIRFCFAKQEQTLTEAAHRLQRLVERSG